MADQRVKNRRNDESHNLKMKLRSQTITKDPEPSPLLIKTTPPEPISTPEAPTHLLEEEVQFRHNNLWQCCSGSFIDKRSAMFLVQVAVVFSALIFCMLQVADNEGDDTVWISLISAIVGNFMPSGLQPMLGDKHV